MAALKEKKPELQKLLRYLSAVRFESISGKSILACKDHPRPDDFLYGSQQTIILIAAKNLRITFKSHFTLTHTSSALSRRQQSRSQDIRKAIHDLFMEYSNLVAGGISQELSKAGIISGLSLPMATHGFDEVLASDLRKTDAYLDHWLIEAESSGELELL